MYRRDIALGHRDIYDYAHQRLKLSKASVYRYIQVYEWVARSHKEWLEPSPKGFIPDLYDAADLMWIEDELEKKTLSSARRAQLEELQKKGIAGNLRQGEVRKLKHTGQQGKQGSSFKSSLTSLRAIRRRIGSAAGIPKEVLDHLDAAIQILANAQPIRLAGLDAFPMRRVFGVGSFVTVFAADNSLQLAVN